MSARPVCLQHGIDLGDDVGGRCAAVEILELAQALLALVEAVEKFVMRLVDGGNVGNAGASGGAGHLRSGLTFTSMAIKARITGSLIRNRNTTPCGPKRPSRRGVTRTRSPVRPSGNSRWPLNVAPPSI